MTLKLCVFREVLAVRRDPVSFMRGRGMTGCVLIQTAEDAIRTFQEWLTAIPRVILNKFGVQVFNPLWQIRRFNIGKLGQTNKANLQILNERRDNII